MITPKFKLSQSESELSIKIYAPFARLADTEIDIDDNVFLFYSSPYYLRLNLPGKLVDSEKEVHKSVFDADEGAYKITCMKQTFGEFFPGLDMLSDILTPKGCSDVNKPLIEVLFDSEGSKEDDEDDLDFFYKQTLPEESNTIGCKYGFTNSYINVFSSLSDELSSVVDIVDPDSKPVSVRKKERMQMEKEAFSEDHYLAELHEQDIILPSLLFQAKYYRLQKENVEYSSTEEETLLKLPRKELFVDKGSKSYVYFSLVDIIYSWCYDHRVTVGETCIESAWNIRKLSSTLCWLDTFFSLNEVVRSSLRRSLVFPLMRNWEMSLLVLQDTIKIFSLGKKQVLKCLMEIHSMFDSYDQPYYILNQLYITDYCVWVQTIKDEHLIALADSLKKVKFSKDDMDLGLLELERASEMLIHEEEEAKKKKKVEGEVKKHTAEEANLNNLVESMGQLSVIENAFAMSRNDNDIEANVPLLSSGIDVEAGLIDSDDDSDDSTDDSSDDSDSSSSSSSSDSDDDSESSNDPDDEEVKRLMNQLK